MKILTTTDGPVVTTKNHKTVAPALPPLDMTQTKAGSQALGKVETPPATRNEWAQKDRNMQRGGVAHDAATIVASMSAMKSDAEVIALFDVIYDHIYKRVQED